MAAFGIFAVTLESTWLAGIPTESLRFDFIVIAVAALAFSFEWQQALTVIIFYGVLMDVSSGAPFGMSIFSYIIIYGFLRAIVAKISFQVGPALLFWVAIISLLDKLLSSVVLMAAFGNLAVPSVMFRTAPSQALFNAVVSLLLVPFLRWYWDLSWEKITRPKGLVMR